MEPVIINLRHSIATALLRNLPIAVTNELRKLYGINHTKDVLDKVEGITTDHHPIVAVNNRFLFKGALYSNIQQVYHAANT